MGLISELRDLLGGDSVLMSDLQPFTVDWTRGFGGPAQAVVRPRSAAEVSGVIGICRRHGVPLIPQGGNTGLVGGAVPREATGGGEDPVILDLSRMNRVRSEPVSGVVEAEAGATLASVQAEARRIDRYYGVDLAARDQATIGGTVATNAGGIRVCAFGMTRQQLLGLEYVLGTGEIVDRMVPLPKDNTGYSLDSLMCGSEGTLGVITRVAVRTLAPPGPSTLVAVPAADLAAALPLLRELDRGQYRVLAAEVVDGAGWRRVGEELGTGAPFDPGEGVALLIEVEDGGQGDGIPAAIGARDEVAVALTPSDQRRLWALREGQTESWSRMGLVHKFDVSLPLAQLAPFVAAAEAGVERLPEVVGFGYFGHIADGNLHLEVVGPEVDLTTFTPWLLGLVAEFGGSISAEHGVGQAKSDYLALRRSPVEIDAMRRIKTALDPDGILNPGALFPV